MIFSSEKRQRFMLWSLSWGERELQLIRPVGQGHSLPGGQECPASFYSAGAKDQLGVNNREYGKQQAKIRKMLGLAKFDPEPTATADSVPILGCALSAVAAGSGLN